MISKSFAVTGALALLSAAAHAGSPPKELYGKSIIVTWTEERNQRNFGESSFRDMIVPLSMTIYVSSVGRPFFRLTSTGMGRHSYRNLSSREGIGATGTSSGGGLRQIQFQGRSLIFTGSSGGGLALRSTITFNETFSACEAQIIAAKLAGAEVGVGRNLFTRQSMEIRSATVTGVSCSVHDGNVFAQ
jgi:hypothetical protein